MSNSIQPNANLRPAKEFKTFCDNLRCPLCGSQLDGNIHAAEARLYCVGNEREYRCSYAAGEEIPRIETLTRWYGDYEYKIEIIRTWFYDDASNYKTGRMGYVTMIDRYNSEINPLYKNNTRKRLFECDERVLFFREPMEEKEFLRKLKLYSILS